VTGRAPAVDRGALERLVEMTGNDPVFVDELVQTYLEDADLQVEAMRAAAGLGSAEAMIRPAHSLKANSLSVGADQLAEQCRQLETDGRSGTVDRARERVEAVAAELGQVKAELTRLRADR
jgi:HPt (histidine-containing phosphotransfer) domain-containing protein